MKENFLNLIRSIYKNHRYYYSESQFAGDIIVYKENPEKFLKTLELISKPRKVMNYKTNIQNSILFLYASIKHLDKNLKYNTFISMVHTLTHTHTHKGIIAIKKNEIFLYTAMCIMLRKIVT